MNSRHIAIRAIVEGRGDFPVKQKPEGSIPEIFAENCFNEKVQRQRLSEKVFLALQKTVKTGHELDPSIAEAVALAMKEWALDKGALHFCHWFQPLTELTAEKHDSFFTPDKSGGILAEFGGKELVRGEPDASSFPSGGLRTTFEARGYTTWDPSSPAFILEHPGGSTLVIPTMFLSWTGEALDRKTPLLRSMEVLSSHALRILRLFGDTEIKRVFTTVGCEQEFFLVDKHFYHARTDLLCSGRTLFGAPPPKGQELEDQYLGAMPGRVLALLSDLELELLRLGVSIETRHNEVAPSQYEIALRFQPANLAADHQMLVMEMLKKTAVRHSMVALLHEKPFAKINGSGKHNNWSLATDGGENLLEPGDTPHKNARFLLFCAASILAVHRHARLLRLSIANMGNDHRLGLHEAPPPILSVFLGEQLYAIFNEVKNGESPSSKHKKHLEIGVSMLPKIPRHSGDRNRTSPFAFTGNKFEFRAVGSNQNISSPNTILNTIVAATLDEFATTLEKKSEEGQGFNQACEELIAAAAKEFEPVLFEGDNYGSSWYEEAKRRGLPIITNTVDAAFLYTSEEALYLFPKYGVYSERELASRQHALLERYVKKRLIEARAASQIGHTMILPAALKYQVDVFNSVNAGADDALLKELTPLIKAFKGELATLDNALEKMDGQLLSEKAVYVRDTVFSSVERLRCQGDALERRVADNYWPLPKYHEMLFIR